MKKKYKLLKNDYIVVEDIFRRRHTLYRIKALRDFGDVKKGDLGGYIEYKSNLSHEGNCWVYDKGKVHENARVTENAKVRNNADVLGSAQLKGNSCAYDNATINDEAILEDNASAYGNAFVLGHAKLVYYASAFDNTIVGGNVLMQAYSKAYGHSRISGDTQMSDYSCAYDQTRISGNVQLRGNSKAYGYSVINGDVTLLNSETYETAILTTGFYENKRLPLPKYELTNETITIEGRVLHRIRALRDFGDVKAGDLGGFIESEKNLSHQGDCWVYNNAKVFNDAYVMDNGKVKEKAVVCGTIIVKDFAQIKDSAVITGDELIIGGQAEISEDVYLIASKRYGTNYMQICENANISGNIRILYDGKPREITEVIHGEEDLVNFPYIERIPVPITDNLPNIKSELLRLSIVSELVDKKINYLNEKEKHLPAEGNPNKKKDEYYLNKIQTFKKLLKNNTEEIALRYKKEFFVSDEEFAVMCDEAKSTKYTLSENEYAYYIQEYGAFSKEDDKELFKKDLEKKAEIINNYKALYTLANEEKDFYINIGKEEVYNRICNDIIAKEKEIAGEITLNTIITGMTAEEVNEILSNTKDASILPEVNEKVSKMYEEIKIKAYSDFNKIHKEQSQKNRDDIEII